MTARVASPARPPTGAPAPVALPILALAAVLALVLACCPAADPVGAPAPLRWQPVSVPVPAGAGRAVLGDLTTCAGRWYLTGAIQGAAGTRPAAWSSLDGRHWTPLPVAPASYYGARHLLYAVGCRDGRIAALGAAVGGAHGNPRTAAWYQRPDGTLAEAVAAFEQFGGPYSVGVTRIAGGPAGWLVVGDWLSAAERSGAAAWYGPSPADLHRQADDPALASTPTRQTSAADALGTPAGWLLVGNGFRFGPSGSRPAPLAAASPDGRHWRDEPVDGGGGLRRITPGPGGDPYAVGTSGAGYAVWRHADGRWSPLGRPAARPGDTDTEPVQSFTGTGGALLAALADRGVASLWLSGTGRTWARVPVPARVTIRGDHRLLAAAGRGRVVLGAETGDTSRIWVAGLA